MKLVKPFEIYAKNSLLKYRVSRELVDLLGIVTDNLSREDRWGSNKSREMILRNLTAVFESSPSWNDIPHSAQEDVVNQIVHSLLFISFCSLNPDEPESSEYYENFVDDVSEIIIMNILDSVYSVPNDPELPIRTTCAICNDTCYPGMFLSPDRELRNFLQSNQKLKEIAQEVAKRAATQVLSPTCYLKKYKLIATLMDLAGAPIEHFVFFSYERRFFINLQYCLNTDNAKVRNDILPQMQEAFFEATECPAIVLKVFRQFAKLTRVKMNPLVLEKINQSSPHKNALTTVDLDLRVPDAEKYFVPGINQGTILPGPYNMSPKMSYARLVGARKFCDLVDLISTSCVDREMLFKCYFYTKMGIPFPPTPMGTYCDFDPSGTDSSLYTDAFSLKKYREAELTAVADKNSQSRSIRNLLHYATMLVAPLVPAEEDLTSLGVEFLAILSSPAKPRKLSGLLETARKHFDYYERTDLLQLLGQIWHVVNKNGDIVGKKILLVEDIKQPSGDFLDDFCKIMGIIEKKNGVKPFQKALEEYVKDLEADMWGRCATKTKVFVEKEKLMIQKEKVKRIIRRRSK